jgi:hypothetical protein
MKKLSLGQMKFIIRNAREALLDIGCLNIEACLGDEDLEIIVHSVIASLSRLDTPYNITGKKR